MTTTLNENTLSSGTQYLYYEGLSASESGAAIYLPRGGDRLAVHVMDGGGTGFNGGTVSIEGTINGTDWFPLLEGPGAITPITFTEEGYAEITTAVSAVRATNDASVGDVDVFWRTVSDF